LRLAAIGAVLLAVWLHVAGWFTAAALLLDVLPGSARPLQWLTPAPITETITFSSGGRTIIADRYRPGDQARHPALVLVYGALREGRTYAPLAALGRSLARAGYVVLNPDLPDLPDEAVSPASLDGLVAAVDAAAQDSRSAGGGVGLFGFSLGGSLALVAAADPRLAARISVVVDVGGYYRFVDIVQAVTTGSIPDEHGHAVPYRIDPVAAATALHTMVRLLPPADQALLSELENAERTDLTSIPEKIDDSQLTPAGQAALALLRNRDPTQVTALYAGLDPAMREAIASTMDPAVHAERIRVQVWALHDLSDPFVPSMETRELARDPRLRGRVHATFSDLLQHTEPAPRPLTPSTLLTSYLPSGWSLLLYIHGVLAAMR